MLVTVGTVIGRTLRKAGLTQAALADAAGVSRYRVNSIINGERICTPDSALRIGTALGILPICLLEMQAAIDLQALEKSGVASNVQCITGRPLFPDSNTC
jgi:addiction module HigA family antidote